MRKARVGDLVEVEWTDAAGYVNEAKASAVVVKANNVGYIVSMDEKSIVLRSGSYADDVGDYTAIPTAWSDKIKVIK